MAHTLDLMVTKPVSLLTTDGKHYLGTLRGFDQALNLVLDDCTERVWSPDQPFQEIDCQVMLVRGDTIAVIGLVEGDTDAVTVAPAVLPIV